MVIHLIKGAWKHASIHMTRQLGGSGFVWYSSLNRTVYSSLIILNSMDVKDDDPNVGKRYLFL